MQLSDQAIDDFIVAYKADFGEDISREEASEMAYRLITLYELLSRKRPE